MSVVDVREAITQAHHEEWAPVVAVLTRRFGDLDIADEAAAEAFATAVERWPPDGVPPDPGAWLTTTARRKAGMKRRKRLAFMPREQESGQEGARRAAAGEAARGGASWRRR